jgi:Glycosyl transferase family group 2
VTTTSQAPNGIERFERLWRFSQEDWVREGWAATANLAARREVMTAIGGFDPAYRQIGEDADVCLRARAAGFRLAYCGAATVFHRAERTLAPLLRRSCRHGYGAHQAHRRLGVGHEAWRDPLPALSSVRALERVGIRPESLSPDERRSLGRLARVAYGARIAGSVWALATRAQ